LVILQSRPNTFLYKQGGMYHFMDTETYDQVVLGENQVPPEIARWLKENMEVQVTLHNDKPLKVEISPFVELKVTESSPGVKGDTVSGASKPVTVETGAVIQVPLFVNPGEKVRVDTRSGLYLERA